MFTIILDTNFIKTLGAITMLCVIFYTVYFTSKDIFTPIFGE